MWAFQTLCDEFFVNTRLRLKLELTPSRESLLHFFEQIRRHYPALHRFRRGEEGGAVLDQDHADDDGRRFIRVDGDMLRFGISGPSALEPVRRFSETILHQAPAQLSLSDLDYDHLEVTYGFNLDYAGNHDELFAEALFNAHPLVSALEGDDRQVVDFQPYLGVTLNDACDLQAYIELKSRTSAYELRCGDFEPSALSVYLTLRKYWGGDPSEDLVAAQHDLLTTGAELAAERVVPHIVRPLADAIASRR